MSDEEIEIPANCPDIDTTNPDGPRCSFEEISKNVFKCNFCEQKYYMGEEEVEEVEVPEYGEPNDISIFAQTDMQSVLSENNFSSVDTNTADIEELKRKVEYLWQYITENVTIVDDDVHEEIKSQTVITPKKKEEWKPRNIFVSGSKNFEIMEMLVDGPKTLEEIHDYLPKVKGKKISIENLEKFIMKDLNMYKEFIIEKTTKFTLKERK